MVSMPTRPKYIKAMISIWAGIPITGVMPVVRPTVARADTASYRASVKLTGTGAVAVIKNPPKKARPVIIKKIVVASMAFAWGMVRLKICTVLLPRALLQINSTSTTKVTVFKPPAVEPEEPPMSITTIESALVASVNLPWSMAAKPAVRNVTTWKNAFNIFCHTGIGPKVLGLFHSNSKVKPAPRKMITPVAISTSLV